MQKILQNAFDFFVCAWPSSLSSLNLFVTLVFSLFFLFNHSFSISTIFKSLLPSRRNLMLILRTWKSSRDIVRVKCDIELKLSAAYERSNRVEHSRNIWTDDRRSYQLHGPVGELEKKIHSTGTFCPRHVHSGCDWSSSDSWDLGSRQSS